MKTVKVKSVEAVCYAPVYNMEVNSHHNFCVNNGIVVHNCMDDVRYLCMTRPEIREEVKDETTFEEQLVRRSFDNAVRNFYKRNNGATLYR